MIKWWEDRYVLSTASDKSRYTGISESGKLYMNYYLYYILNLIFFGGAVCFLTDCLF